MKHIYHSTTPLDKRACERFRLSPEILMENAASALESLLNSITHKGSVVTILCGSGDNGADGYALARRICGDYSVRICQLKEPKSPLCLLQSERLEECEVKYIKKLLPCDVVVDCVVGSGLRGELDSELYEVLRLARKLARIAIACDIPSGLSELRTRSEGAQRIFKADYTLCMGAITLAHLSDVAKDYVGELRVANLGLSAQHYEVRSHIKMLEPSDLRLPLREKADTHKGDFGHAVVYLGEKCGAGILSARAALAFGAGLVSAVLDSHAAIESSTPDSVESTPHAHDEPSLFSHTLPPTPSVLDSESSLLPAHTSLPLSFALPCELMLGESLPKNATALALGMGLGVERASRVLEELAHSPLPCVLDADVFSAPNLKHFLSERAKIESISGANLILTPHPKEFDRLLQACDMGAYEPSKRTEQMLHFTQAYPHAVLLLKGANVYIAHAGELYINPLGSNALAKGGMGDVLSGLILALLAQGKPALESTLTASLAHALAAKNALRANANYALTPSSLIDSIAKLHIKG